MKNLPVLIVCLALAGGITSPVHSLQETTPSSMAVREVVEELKQVYSTDIILGKPLEVDHLKIIPLATVGIGYGQRGVSEDRNATRGAGGIVSPVGVLVVSPQGVQLLPIAKGVLEQVLGAVTPVVLQQIRHTAPQAATVAERQARLPIPELLVLTSALFLQALVGHSEAPAGFINVARAVTSTAWLGFRQVPTRHAGHTLSCMRTICG